jgi:hypothetical protein
VLIYFHGGGFFFGNTGDEILRNFLHLLNKLV